MPLYEYECEACERRFEIIQKFSDPAPDVCTLCGKGPVRRLMSSPAIQLKGTGWYITDYSQKGKSSDASSESSGDGKKSDAKKSDAAKADGGSSGTATKSESPAPAASPAKD